MIVTISRQFAAGGSEVAKRVAEALGWTLVDNQVVRLPQILVTTSV